jgi:hypothetical protein
MYLVIDTVWLYTVTQLVKWSHTNTNRTPVPRHFGTLKPIWYMGVVTHHITTPQYV